MTDPVLELQGAIEAHLREGSPPLLSVALYDRVPKSAAFPYASFGPSDLLSDDADCLTSFEATIQIDVWSREVGFPECRRISEDVRSGLHEAELSLTDNALLTIRHRQTRYFRDPDGITSHGVLTFEAIIEQP